MLATAGLGGIGGGGGRGNDAGITEPSPESKLPESGKGGGGGGGGGGTSKSTSSDSGCDDDVDAPPLAEAADRGILGPAYQSQPKLERERQRDSWRETLLNQNIAFITQTKILLYNFYFYLFRVNNRKCITPTLYTPNPQCNVANNWKC